MYLIHIASELAPIAKVGGLGDVLYGLCQELSRLNHTVEILLPKYDCLNSSHLSDLKVEQREIWSYDGLHRYNNTVWSGRVDGLKVLLIEPHHPEYFFSRGMIYGCPDDTRRFIYFCRVALEYLHKAGKRPDVLHLHDWPTALVPVLYREMYFALGYRVGGTVLTIHNLEHQGKCAPAELFRIGLYGENDLLPDMLLDPVLPGHINLLKGGIENADLITTVSPTYEREILQPEGGCHLHETLRKYKGKLHGILNGIDEHFWNPDTDLHLVRKYNTHHVTTPQQLAAVFAGKQENKRHVRTHLGLQECSRPLVASVTRLVPQKGPELIQKALERTLEKGGQFILLGSTCDPDYKRTFEKLKMQFEDHPHAAVVLDKDEALAHLIFAAADMLIIPSIFEPCGLTQMIALRYGTVPIARVTGGLADTVFDIDTSTRPLEERNGFTFDFPDAQGVHWALDRALECHQKDPKKWEALLLQGMKKDFSWKRAAVEYLALYNKFKGPMPS